MPTQAGDSTKPDVRAALEAVLASPLFAGKRRGELLRYLVERTLEGKGDSLTEYGIALDVFRKPPSFDPRSESTIRAEMSRVRKALADFYETTGASGEWRFEFPARGYTPDFVRADVPGEPAPVAAETVRHSRKWIWIALLLVVLAGSGAAFWKLRLARGAIRSVIVLPFTNLTGDAANDHVADGITEGLTDSLAHLASLRVVARTSAFQFRGQALDIREIGRRVNADAVVEGSIQKAGDAYKLTVQVNRTADGYHILSRAFDGGPRDLARLQGEMAAPVVAVLRPREALPATRAPDPQAWDMVLKARTLRGLAGIDTFDQSVVLLNQAIQLDPSYAGAWAELANTYASAATNLHLNTLGAAQKATAAATRALELDPASADAYSARGMVDALVFLDWQKGDRELREAMRLAPQNAYIHQRLANVELMQGHFDSALREAKIAEDLDPLVGNAGVAVAMVYFMQRRYRDALTQSVKVARLHPDVVVLRSFVGAAYDALGDYPHAKTEFDAVAVKYPLDAEIRTILALVHARRPQEARQRLEKLEKAGEKDAFSYAVIYGELGERDKAFTYLEQAWQDRNCWMLKVYPFLDPLRADPRYAGFLKRAHLDR